MLVPQLNYKSITFSSPNTANKQLLDIKFRMLKTDIRMQIKYNPSFDMR